MSAAVSMVLADLEARAGASDGDRLLWLAERRQGITATEVRDLVMLGDSYKRTLLKEKLDDTPTPDLSSIPVIGWGRTREPIIAETIRQRYALNPESRVFHAADDSRFLASPDGVGVTWEDELVTSEIKTAGMNIAVGSPAYEKKGYGLQQQWVMRVTGATRSLFAWEERIEVGRDQFEPGALRFEWVARDEVTIARLEKVAAEFLAELDEARRALEAGEAAVVDDHLDTLAFNVLKFRDAESSATKAKESAWADLKAALKDRATFSQESALARISWTRGGKEPTGREVDVPTVDVEAAKLARPDVLAKLEKAQKALETAKANWDAVLVEHTTVTVEQEVKTVRENLTVTPIKTKGMSK